MRNYLIRAALTASLYHTRSSQDEIAKYESRTRPLEDLDSYPCPACFVVGEEVTLELRMHGSWAAQASCPRCKGRWDIPVPDKGKNGPATVG